MALSLGGLLSPLRELDRILGLEQKHGRLIEAQAKRLDELADRVFRLEAREQILIAEAKAAASAAAAIVSAQNVGDLSRHVGTLQEQVRRLETIQSNASKLPPHT